MLPVRHLPDIIRSDCSSFGLSQSGDNPTDVPQLRTEVPRVEYQWLDNTLLAGFVSASSNQQLEGHAVVDKVQKLQPFRRW